ncbi:hypothetical protein CRG98_013418 [Punica granatum]|uniref:Reverse transcriptase domain-containing protein n=1 Tax=Punica granatum TaxID=22663 RepID=A0A2I0KC97_PUNGR|nr:hypothetical protein CRG98_013418 [Punica granatum]
MDCVTTTTMQVLWNGEATEEFIPKRGIRQGCPLSPYLFVLCIERLAHRIYDLVSFGRWRPIRVGAHGLAISHIMFADDLLLFAEASKGQMREVMGVLDTFLHSRAQKSLFQGVVDCVQSRLNGWSASTLSMAGRTTLVQSVLQAIPMYTMQLQASVRDFVLGSGGWDWHRISRILPHSIILHIASVLPPGKDCREEDVPYWRLDSSGDYSVKTAYQLLTADSFILPPCRVESYMELGGTLETSGFSVAGGARELALQQGLISTTSHSVG